MPQGGSAVRHTNGPYLYLFYTHVELFMLKHHVRIKVTKSFYLPTAVHYIHFISHTCYFLLLRVSVFLTSSSATKSKYISLKTVSRTPKSIEARTTLWVKKQSAVHSSW